MSNIAIQVEHLYKQYRLGMVTTGTISHDLNRWYHKIRGKEDPYLLVTAENDRTQKTANDYVWALNDINFEVKKGEVLGIIGKNGAGKSTLLKILSKVTSPTKGSINVKGRIASLLEVGTGFHPELSGKENIYLNGAILGMTKQEIKKKFDEIVDFSGVDKYIDTPVKRYSSGMYVRLAFAVAAHLESEILIIDEVLAVGDAEFQKKCLGKMREVSEGEGRTVLFVSHNMTAVKSLCTAGVLMVKGKVMYTGTADQCINKYTETKNDLNTHRIYEDPNSRPGGDLVKLIEYKLCDENHNIIDSFDLYQEVYVEIRYQVKSAKFDLYPNLHFFDKEDNYLFVSSIAKEDTPSMPGEYITRFRIPKYTFNCGKYTIGIAITCYPGTDVQFNVNPAIVFEVLESDISLRTFPYTGALPGYSRLNLLNETKIINQ
jgi:ABC-type polysaccharide/polyol phosphate transport system ATPase subunit